MHKAWIHTWIFDTVTLLFGNIYICVCIYILIDIRSYTYERKHTYKIHIYGRSYI